jgi:hypothetical protein
MPSPGVSIRMLAHFLERDLRDHSVAWVLLLILTALGLVAGLMLGHWGWIALFQGYFMFGVLLSGSIAGSIWRTQHQLSRHYLLSLPIAHVTLFMIQQVRMAMFWAPLLGLVWILPVLGVISPPAIQGFWVLYYGGAAVSIALLVQHSLWTTLEAERISAFVPKGARLWSHAKNTLAGIGLYGAFAWAWGDLLEADRFMPWAGLAPRGVRPAPLVFLGGIIVLALWVRHNARRWCVTL